MFEEKKLTNSQFQILQNIIFIFGTTVTASLLLVTSIFVNSAAAETLTAKNSYTSEIEVATVKENNTVVEQEQPQLIAQGGSSGTTGDTFGDINKLRQELLIEPIVEGAKKSQGAAAPGSSAGTPTAYGASSGQAYIGGGLYVPLEKGKTDGSLSVGTGFGDPVKSVGVEVSVDINSIGTQDFGDSGQLGVKLHKFFTDGTAVAVGWSNPVKWGDSNRNAKETVYGVVTKAFDLQPNSENKLPLTVSLGVGSGTFRSEGDVTKNDQGVNVFGSLGLRVIPEAAVVASWTGNTLNAGGSFAPFKDAPVVINAVFTNLTNTFDSGVGFSLSGGYSFQF